MGKATYGITARQEFQKDMWGDTPAAIAYWACKGITFTAESIEATDEDGDTVTVTFAQFCTAINKFAGLDHKRAYFKRFAHDWRWDLDYADYDTDILDYIFQLAAFDKQIYG